MHTLSAFLSLFLCAFPVNCIPAALPETVGADGDCSPPDITVASVEKVKQGPYLVTGARADANPHGGSASFNKQYSVSTTITGTVGLDLEGDRTISKILTLGLGLNPQFSIAKTTGTAVSAISACPANDMYNFTITWGLQYYQYSWHVTGTKTYYGYDPLQRCADSDVISHRNGGTIPYDEYYPAKQDGAQDGSDSEVEFQCCVDSRSYPYPDNPVCPDAT
ncbi:uncharacterized protein KY384_003499 [Bacidia gigantensis]|uniref:uncharacterized protein n=1 Tax=Bacidia gigantensis TaxID=2732470 RepID=UPI001D04AE7A|nr:uncharacterized protein KY384_003499 [Bacidia gigantensis]KAG8531863.1 hypothetical protein KY384_003499 [Bacidia gigantensis]